MPVHESRCPSCGAAVEGDAAPLAAHCAYCRTPSPRTPTLPTPAAPASHPFENLVRGLVGFEAASSSVTVTRVDPSVATTYEVNGRVYESLDEVPAEMREMLAHAEATLASAQAGGPSAVPVHLLREVQMTSSSPGADAALQRLGPRPDLVFQPAAARDPARDTRLVFVTIVVTVLALLAVLGVVAIVK